MEPDRHDIYETSRASLREPRDCRRTMSLLMASSMLGVSERTLSRMAAEGRTPRPFRVGKRCLRFNTEEFDAWFEAGMPRHEVWEKVWAGREALRFRCTCGKRWSPSVLWRHVVKFINEFCGDGGPPPGAAPALAVSL